MGSPFFPDDADAFLADFGEDLVCVAVPDVTRGMLDDTVVEKEINGFAKQVQLTVLKVKRGAFDDTNVTNTRITVASRNLTYSIDSMLPRESSLFDYYALQKVRSAT